MSNLYIFDTINVAIVVAVQGGPPQALMNVYSHFVWGLMESIDIVRGHGTDPHGWITLWTTWSGNLDIFDKINVAIVVAVQGGPPQALITAYSHFVWGLMESFDIVQGHGTDPHG